MVNIIDARGRSCPEPVIMTKNEIDRNPNIELQVLVDTHVAVENIARFVTGKGYNVNIEQTKGEYKIHIKNW